MTSALFSKKLKARKYDMRDDINSMKITETYVKLFKVRKNRGISDRKKIVKIFEVCILSWMDRLHFYCDLLLIWSQMIKVFQEFNDLFTPNNSWEK